MSEYDWFWNNDQRAVEPVDDGGGYPCDQAMDACLCALNLNNESIGEQSCVSTQ